MNLAHITYRFCDFIRQGFKNYGVKFPFFAIYRQIICWKRHYWGPKRFDLNGTSYSYLHHPYMFNTERTVEVGLVLDFLKGKQGAILEIGHVLSNYHFFPHTIVDKYEIAPNVINEDIVSYFPDKKFDYIVSISTLEHVGWDENPCEPEKIFQAFERVSSLLKENGQMVITMPLGYNSYLDNLIREKKTGFTNVFYLKRLNSTNQWKEVKLENLYNVKYNEPYQCANAIVVIFVKKNKEINK